MVVRVVPSHVSDTFTVDTNAFLNLFPNLLDLCVLVTTVWVHLDFFSLHREEAWLLVFNYFHCCAAGSEPVVAAVLSDFVRFWSEVSEVISELSVIVMLYFLYFPHFSDPH